jgi:hypothetical protein
MNKQYTCELLSQTNEHHSLLLYGIGCKKFGGNCFKCNEPDCKWNEVGGGMSHAILADTEIRALMG